MESPVRNAEEPKSGRVVCQCGKSVPVPAEKIRSGGQVKCSCGAHVPVYGPTVHTN